MKATTALFLTATKAVAAATATLHGDEFASQVVDAQQHHHEDAFLRGSIPNTNNNSANSGNPNRSIDRGAPEQWLLVHNDARLEKQTEYIATFVPVQWADSLEDMAQENADQLVQDCVNRIITTNPRTGQNAMIAQRTSEFQTPETVLNLWMSKWDSGYPTNKYATQVVWLSTEYIGCAQAASSPSSNSGGNAQCTATVCLYSRPGNCGINENNWEKVTFKEVTSCGPFCPPGYTNTTAKFSTKCVEDPSFLK